jgi:cysteine desulfuration protein SufE
MSIKETEEQIIEEFNSFDDWMDKYNYLIEMGKAVPPIKEEYKKPENLINGCQSRVWLHAEYTDGLVHFTADSDAVITKGIAWLLIRALNKNTADDIINADMAFLDEIGLKEHLSPTRSNGLVSMLKQMKFYAMAFKAKS